MAQSKVMPDVLTDEEMDKLSSGMPDTLSDEEMARLESAPSGPPTIKQEFDYLAPAKDFVAGVKKDVGLITQKSKVPLAGKIAEGAAAVLGQGVKAAFAAIDQTHPGVAYLRNKYLLPAAGKAYDALLKNPVSQAAMKAGGKIAQTETGKNLYGFSQTPEGQELTEAGKNVAAYVGMKTGKNAPSATEGVGKGMQEFAKLGQGKRWKLSGTPEQVIAKREIAADKNIWGKARPAAEKTNKQISTQYNELKSKIQAASDASDTKVDAKKLLDDAEVAALKNADPNKEAAIKNVFENVRARVERDYGDGQMNLADAQIFKQKLGEWGDDAWDATKKGKSINAQSADHQAYVSAYDQFKKTVENMGPPGVKEQNKELSKLLDLRRDLRRRVAVEERNNFIPLDEVVSGVGAALSLGHGNPIPAMIYGAQVASKSPSILKGAYKTGKALETLGKPRSLNVLKRASTMAKDMRPPRPPTDQGGFVGAPPASSPRPPARDFLAPPVENAGEGPARAFLGKDFPKTEFAETPSNRARRLQVNKEIDEQGGLPYEQKPKPEPEKPAAPNDAEQKRTTQESGPAYDEDYQKSPDFQDVESLTPEEETANSYIANLSEDDFGKLYDPDGPDLKGAPPELRTEIEKIRKENADAVGEETARQKSAAAEEEFDALKNVQKGNPKELDIPNRGSDREMLDKAGGAAGEDLEQVAKAYGYEWPLSEKDYEQLMRDVSARKKTLRNSFSIRKRK